MEDELKKFAIEYIESVNIVWQLMLKGLNIKSREDMRQFKIYNPMGKFELNGINEYAFHGRGCRFFNNDIKIDWDFGYKDNIICGINPWLLANYIKDNEQSESYSGDRIKDEFEKAVNNGEMIKKYELYYFK